jgi:hypothetical protein
LNFRGDPAIGIRTVGFEDGAVTLDRRDAVTIGGIGHPASFSFVFGGNREFDMEPVMIERPNLELAGRHCPSAVGLSGRYARVTLGRRSSDRGSGLAQDPHFPCLLHDAVTKEPNTPKLIHYEKTTMRKINGRGKGTTPSN